MSGRFCIFRKIINEWHRQPAGGINRQKMKMFTHAIVRLPSPEMIGGITTAGLGLPDFGTALVQHREYIRALESCGLEVRVLEADTGHPDAVFVEDVAVCVPGCAIIARPGAPSRMGEESGMSGILGDHYSRIETIVPPGTLEGGDVMMAGNHCFVGLSNRTNRDGAGQLGQVLGALGIGMTRVPLRDGLHLKTSMSYLENQTLLLIDEWYGYPDFQRFRRIRVPQGEEYAANSLWINGTVLMPSGFPGTAEAVKMAGYPVIGLKMSEFRKLDGGLSCLSLRF
jgi:dimethylargininase